MSPAVRGSGRKQSNVASLFTAIPRVGKMDRVRCNFCNKSISKNGTRMTKHIETCVKCPQNVKDKHILFKTKSFEHGPSLNLSGPSGSGDISILASSGTSSLIPKPTIVTSTPLKSKYMQEKEVQQAMITRFMDKVTPQDQIELDQKLARAIYTSDCPLKLLENPYWQDFMKAMRPSYVVPSRYVLSNKLLNREYLEVKSHVSEIVAAAESVGFMCDGWSNVRNEAIINYVITVPQPIFWKSTCSGKESHTGLYMASEMKKVIEEIGPKKVIGIVTDNASNMKLAWSILKEQFKHIYFYGCIAHGLNLLFTDYKNIPTLMNFMAEAVTIVKEVRQKQKTGATFIEVQTNLSHSKHSLKLPVKTRWGSIVQCLTSLQSNKQVLKTMAIAEDSASIFSIQVKQSVLSDVFWSRVSGFISLLRPIYIAIKVMESDKPKICDVVEIFSKLEENMNENLQTSPFTVAEEKKVRDTFEFRKSFCLKEIHFAANLLHPVLKGKKLTDEQSIDACEVIYNISQSMNNVKVAEVMSQLASFRSGQDIFARKIISETAKMMSPAEWWGGICSSMDISKVALRILNLPPTSAACERTFSKYANIHSQKRNKLLNDRAGKLLFVSENLMLPHSKKRYCIEDLNISSIVPQKEYNKANEIVDINEGDEKVVPSDSEECDEDCESFNESDSFAGFNSDIGFSNSDSDKDDNLNSDS